MHASYLVDHMGFVYPCQELGLLCHWQCYHYLFSGLCQMRTTL
jgi:hypothetical protein